LQPSSKASIHRKPPALACDRVVVSAARWRLAEVHLTHCAAAAMNRAMIRRLRGDIHGGRGYQSARRRRPPRRRAGAIIAQHHRTGSDMLKRILLAAVAIFVAWSV
jgi:hypothetical protein